MISLRKICSFILAFIKCRVHKNVVPLALRIQMVDMVIWRLIYHLFVLLDKVWNVFLKTCCHVTFVTSNLHTSLVIPMRSPDKAEKLVRFQPL